MTKPKEAVYTDFSSDLYWMARGGMIVFTPQGIVYAYPVLRASASSRHTRMVISLGKRVYAVSWEREYVEDGWLVRYARKFAKETAERIDSSAAELYRGWEHDRRGVEQVTEGKP